MFVSLIHYVIDDTLSEALSDLCQTLLQSIDLVNMISVANVSVHSSMPKENILAFSVTKEYTKY